MKTALLLTCAFCLLVQNIFGQGEYQQIYPKQRHHELRNPRNLSEPPDIYNHHKFKVGDRNIQITAHNGQNPSENQIETVKNVLTEDFLVNDIEIRHNLFPSVTMDSQGNFVVAWQDSRNGNWDIYFQRYNSLGIALGINTKASDDTGSAGQGYPTITMDGGGNFVIAWEDYRNGNNNSDIYYQRYTSSGLAQGKNIKVNTLDFTFQEFPKIAMDLQGNFMVTWQDLRNGNWDIYYQRYNSNGTPQGTNTKVNDNNDNSLQLSPSIAIDSQGNFVIAWIDARNYGWDIYCQRFNSVGLVQGINFKVNDASGYAVQFYPSPSVSMNSHGNFIIVWLDQRYPIRGIYFQRYNSNGTAQGMNTRVNDHEGGFRYSSLSIDSDDNFVIVWQDQSFSSSSPDIIGQRYFGNGSPKGSNYRIVVDGPNHIEACPVVCSNNSKIIFSWMDNRRSLYYEDIYAKIVDWDWNGIPVELTTFKAKISGNKVQLNWTTATEINNRGFEVERSKDKISFLRIGFVEGKGTTTEPSSYIFEDKNLFAGNYFYRLKQIDYDGSYEYSSIVEVGINIPSKFELSQNYPNPFNPSTKISYSIPCVGARCIVPVQLKVYDILGNEIATLVDEEKPAGSYEVEFPNAGMRHASSAAKTLPSGVYFYQLKVYPAEGGAGDFIQTKKMLLLR